MRDRRGMGGPPGAKPKDEREDEGLKVVCSGTGAPPEVFKLVALPLPLASNIALLRSAILFAAADDPEVVLVLDML